MRTHVLNQGTRLREPPPTCVTYEGFLLGVYPHVYLKVSRTAQTNPTGQTHVTHPIPMFLHVQSQLPRQPERRSTFHAKWCHVTDEGMRPDIGKFVMSLVVDFEILLSHTTPHHTPHHSTPNIVRLVRIGRQCTKLGRRTRLVHRNAVV